MELKDVRAKIEFQVCLQSASVCYDEFTLDGLQRFLKLTGEINANSENCILQTGDWYVHTICTKQGCIFSDGRLTDGKTHCSKIIKDWFDDLNSKNLEFIEL